MQRGGEINKQGALGPEASKVQLQELFRYVKCEKIISFLRQTIMNFLGEIFSVKNQGVHPSTSFLDGLLSLLLDTATWAVSSHAMQDHFGAKSANWLAS